MWTKGYTTLRFLCVWNILFFLSWQIQWWWVLMIHTCGLQVQVQVCLDFCCSGKQKFQTKNQQQHVDSLGKKTHTGPTDVYGLKHQQKKNGPLDPWVFKPPLPTSPRFTMPTMLKFTEMEAPHESEQLMQESAVFGWETLSWHPFFFGSNLGKVGIPYWFHGHLPGGINVGRWTGLISLTVSWGRWMGGGWVT